MYNVAFKPNEAILQKGIGKSYPSVRISSCAIHLVVCGVACSNGKFVFIFVPVGNTRIQMLYDIKVCSLKNPREK